MGWRTSQGYTPADVNGNLEGLPELSDGVPLLAATMNKLLRDLQPASYNAQFAGVLAGGVCYTEALDVKIPAGTSYFAKQVWTLDALQSVSVSDDATTYLWGCSDGVIRVTDDTNPPDGFDATTACILTRANAANGYATIDNTVQQRARVARGDNRFVSDNGGFMPQPISIPEGVTCLIDVGFQYIFQCPFEVNGTLIVNGRGKTEVW